MKLNLVTIVSQVLRLDNSADNERGYDIKADVNYQGNEVASIQSGTLRDADGNVVSFASYNGTDNLRVEFNGAPDRGAAIEAIDDFIASVKNYNSDSNE